MQAVTEASRVLECAGLSAEDSRREASLLARWILEWDEASWLIRRNENATPEFAARLDAATWRRARREPLAYITGEREFYGRAFRVSPDVLIPRPETELVIDEALARLPPEATTTVIDVGSGSGCLAITIALERPRVRVVAVDISSAARAVGRDNAVRHGVGDRVEFRHGDLLDGFRSSSAGLVISNPPYVPEVDRWSLAPEVRDFEPVGALFAGPDGLDVIRRLIPAAASALVPGGFLIFEFGWEQSSAVTEIVRNTPGVSLTAIRNDLQQIPRVAVARRDST